MVINVGIISGHDPVRINSPRIESIQYYVLMDVFVRSADLLFGSPALCVNVTHINDFIN